MFRYIGAAGRTPGDGGWRLAAGRGVRDEEGRWSYRAWGLEERGHDTTVYKYGAPIQLPPRAGVPIFAGQGHTHLKTPFDKTNKIKKRSPEPRRSLARSQNP